MAVNDVYKVSAVAEYDGVNVINQYYFQEETLPNTGPAIDRLLEGFIDDFIPQLKTLHVTEYTYSCVTARKVAPSPTQVRTTFISEAGDQTGDGLPSTSHTRMNYYRLPHTSTHWNQWKFSGISEAWHRKGILLEVGWNQYATVAGWIRDNTITQDGGSWRFILPLRSTDNVGQQLAKVSQFNVQPAIANSRSRQLVLCTG